MEVVSVKFVKIFVDISISLMTYLKSSYTDSNVSLFTTLVTGTFTDEFGSFANDF